MAEFDVTLSDMTSTASDIRSKTATFREEAANTLKAAQTLSEGWQGFGYDEFVENMNELHSWMDQMAEALERFAQELDKGKEDYEGTDARASSNF